MTKGNAPETQPSDDVRKTTQELQLEHLKIYYGIFAQITTLSTATAVIMLGIFKDVVKTAGVETVGPPLAVLAVAIVASLIGLAYVALSFKPGERAFGTYFPRQLPYVLFRALLCFALGIIFLVYAIVNASPATPS